ncbi:SH3 domain [Trypanosoma melophagium]|uniref:SH3 domain n=1 Tax=Trypanosoma melophagium TaxID=715481 RepID=UPI00351A3099|nr:SH3 domain [Trypanosoma melophagium]
MRLTQATHDYKNKGRYYLPILKGDLILILEEHPSGWWIGENVMGIKGVVPSTFLQEYVINSPSEELFHEFSLMKMAEKFSIDLTHHAPTPLRVGETFSPSEIHCDTRNMVNIENNVEKFLLQRETAREHLKKCLRDLEKENNDSLLKDDTFHDSDVIMLKVSISRGQIDTLDAHRREKQEKLRSLKGKIKEMKCHISAKLLQLVDEILMERSVHNIRTIFLLDFLHEQLQKFHEKVQIAERELSILSKSLQKTDCSCREWKKSLSDRITLRDAKIRAFLKFWSEEAEASKVAYVQDKARCYHQESLRREEEKKLKNLIEERREKYIRAEDELQYWRDKANVITETLKLQSTLEQLTEAIQQASKEEQKWKEKMSPSIGGG